MTDFWVKEAVSILRQNGSGECAEAVKALAERLAETTRLLRKFHGEHYTCADPHYSCPASDTWLGEGECDCGFDEVQKFFGAADSASAEPQS